MNNTTNTASATDTTNGTPKTPTTPTTPTSQGRPYYEYVIRQDDYDPNDPYRRGDYLLLVDVAHWLLSAYDHGRQEWELMNEEHTEDALLTALLRMRLNIPALVGFHRLLQNADDLVTEQLRTRKSQLEEVVLPTPDTDEE